MGKIKILKNGDQWKNLLIKTNIAVFISGKGSNLKSLIIKYSKKKNSLFEIKLVISNNFNIKGLEIANKSKIKNYYIKYLNAEKF